MHNGQDHSSVCTKCPHRRLSRIVGCAARSARVEVPPYSGWICGDVFDFLCLYLNVDAKTLWQRILSQDVCC